MVGECCTLQSNIQLCFCIGSKSHFYDIIFYKGLNNVHFHGTTPTHLFIGFRSGCSIKEARDNGKGNLVVDKEDLNLYEDPVSRDCRSHGCRVREYSLFHAYHSNTDNCYFLSSQTIMTLRLVRCCYIALLLTIYHLCA